VVLVLVVLVVLVLGLRLVAYERDDNEDNRQQTREGS